MEHLFDVLSVIGAVGALFGFYATWQTFMIKKRAERERRPKLDININKIVYGRFLPDVAEHTITATLTNTSSCPFIIKGLVIKIYGKELISKISSTLAVNPYQPKEHTFLTSGDSSLMINGNCKAEFVFYTDKDVVVSAWISENRLKDAFGLPSDFANIEGA